MDAGDVLILTRREIARLMPLAEAISAVEEGFRALALGKATAPQPMHIPASGGGFHVKAATLAAERRSYVAVKINGNFPANPVSRGLPTIQGAIVLFDGESGSPLAVMDSIEITAKRTAAATGVATRHLARPESRVATVCGCGAQGRVQLEALSAVLPLRQVFAWDVRSEAAGTFAQSMSERLGLDVRPVTDLRSATLESDAIVTCTTATAPFLTPDLVGPRTFIAAVGADNPEKSEIAPTLMARGKVVADVLAQCVNMGDLHHAIAAGVMTADRVHAELADIVAGRRRGRESADEITIFDSTGTGIEDVAAAMAVYELATRDAGGTYSSLSVKP
jgi:ornithine cyclodeaminase/alanine dehydrogenase-like protein (mu-crystallin family)